MEQASTVESATDTTTKSNCCQRFCSELNPFGRRSTEGWFSTRDPVSGRTIDIAESFNPSSHWWLTFAWKFIILTVGWASFGVGMTVVAKTGFYFAYLTSWGVTMCCLYLSMNFINCLLSSKTTQTATVSWRIFITWIFFIIGIHTTSVATLLYWPLIYDPEDTVIYFSTIMGHGGLFLLLLIDGLFVNRIPVRIYHWFVLILPFDFLYIIWSLIHDFATNLGNPDNNDTDPTTNDDAIYQGVLEWSTNWQKTLTWMVVCIFGLGIIMFLIIWTIGNVLCGDRLRYYNTNTNRSSTNITGDSTQNKNRNEHDVESTDMYDASAY